MPEVDTPGHDNAIIMSEYADTHNPRLDGHPQDINCSVHHPPAWDYTQDVGYSGLCPGSANTWVIVRAIVSQLAAMSPGPYYDMGGDEVPVTVLSHHAYASFVSREAPGPAPGSRADRSPSTGSPRLDPPAARSPPARRSARA